MSDDIVKLVRDLETAGVRFEIVNGLLVFDTRSGKHPTEGVRAVIAQHGGAIKALIEQRQRCERLGATPELTEDVEATATLEPLEQRALRLWVQTRRPGERLGPRRGAGE